MSMKRWNFTYNPENHSTELYECSDGLLVKFTDVEPILIALKQVSSVIRRELPQLQAEIDLAMSSGLQSMLRVSSITVTSA